jgi:hypothetical protein
MPKKKKQDAPTRNKPMLFRKLRFHEKLASIPPLSVATLAATLVRRKGHELEAIRSAYRLLDIAEHCNQSLKWDASVEAGITSYEDGVNKDDSFYQEANNAPHYEYEFDENGSPKPVPFDEGLTILIPLAQNRKEKSAVRRCRFKEYVSQLYLEARPEQCAQERLIEVSERVCKMQKEGIPANVFGTATVLYQEWWKRSESERHAKDGEKGQAVKKAKEAAKKAKEDKEAAKQEQEGQVKSKNDKRKGARPLKKVVKKR